MGIRRTQGSQFAVVIYSRNSWIWPAFVVLLTAVIQGCGKPVAQPFAPEPPTTLASASSAFPIRLAREVLTQERSRADEKLTLDGRQFAPSLESFADGTTGTVLSAPVDPFPASDFTECRVRIRSRQGGKIRLLWSSNLDPDTTTNPGVEFPIIASDSAQDYAVRLNRYAAETWAGTIDRVWVALFLPSDDSVLESVTFRHAPPEGPDRITLDNVTMEAIVGRSPIWKFTVPPNGMLSAHVGLLPRASALPGADGVTFRIRLVMPDGGATVLSEATVAPAAEAKLNQWSAMDVDLKELAGQDVTLSFDVDPRESVRGDYAVWGNPLVFSRDPVPATIPVILISNDTLRADHLSCYGYERPTSPNIDAFAEEAILFEKAFTPETWTLTAHVSMLTGLYPTRHGVTSSTNLAETVPTLPGILRDHGYLTGGFTGYKIWMLPWRGLAHGLDTYSTPEITRDIFSTLALTRAWLESHQSNRFFLFFHNYDLHSKYEESGCDGCDLPYFPPKRQYLNFSAGTPEPATLRDPNSQRPTGTRLLFAAEYDGLTLSPDEVHYMKLLYDDTIGAVDAGIGELFADLKRRGLYDPALIVVTADHGELFGEHGQYLHEHLYEGAAHIPLLIKLPHGQFGGKRVSDMVVLTDVVPTVLDVLGLPPVNVDGRSLIGLARGEPREGRPTFIRRQMYRAVRSEDWKLILNVQSNAMELYRIGEDPHEERNVVLDAPPELPPLRAALDRFFAEDAYGWHMRFHTPDPDWRGALTITTPDRIDRCSLLYGGPLSRADLFTADDNGLRVTLGPLEYEEVLVRTASPAGELVVTLSSDKPFSTAIGDEAAVTGTTYQTVLKGPAPTQKVPGQPADSSLPSLQIWYEGQIDKGSAALPLSAEEKAALDALGYGKSTPAP